MKKSFKPKSSNLKKKRKKVSNKFIRKFKGKNHKITRAGLDEIIHSKKSRPIHKQDAIQAFKHDLSEKIRLEKKRSSLSTTIDIYSKIRNETNLIYLKEINKELEKEGNVLEVKKKGSKERPKFLESNFGFYRRKFRQRRDQAEDIIDRILRKKAENPRKVGVPNIDGYIWDNFRYGNHIKKSQESSENGRSTQLNSDIYSCSALESSFYKNKINRMNEDFLNDIANDYNRLDSIADRRNSNFDGSNSSLINLYDGRTKELLKSSSSKHLTKRKKSKIGQRKGSSNSTATASKLTKAKDTRSESYLDVYFNNNRTINFHRKMEEKKPDFTTPKLDDLNFPNIYEKRELKKKKRRKLNTDRVLGRKQKKRFYELR